MSKKTKKQQIEDYKAQGLSDLEAEIQVAKDRVVELQKKQREKEEKEEADWKNRVFTALEADPKIYVEVLELIGLADKIPDSVKQKHSLETASASPQPETESASQTEGYGGYHEYETSSFGA